MGKDSARKKANKRADKKRREMAASVKRNKATIDKLKRALGGMRNDDQN